eukprot:4099773-Prymnesium_polylepis.1
MKVHMVGHSLALNGDAKRSLEDNEDLMEKSAKTSLAGASHSTSCAKESTMDVLEDLLNQGRDLRGAGINASAAIMGAVTHPIHAMSTDLCASELTDDVLQFAENFPRDANHVSQRAAGLATAIAEGTISPVLNVAASGLAAARPAPMEDPAPEAAPRRTPPGRAQADKAEPDTAQRSNEEKMPRLSACCRLVAVKPAAPRKEHLEAAAFTPAVGSRERLTPAVLDRLKRRYG